MHSEMSPTRGEAIDGDSAAAAAGIFLISHANKTANTDHITPCCVGAAFRELDACCGGSCFLFVVVVVVHRHVISLLGTNNDIVCPSFVIANVDVVATRSLQKDKETRKKREITKHRR